MNSYRVSFYKDLLNSDGHSFKCLQRQVDVAIGRPVSRRWCSRNDWSTTSA